MSRIRTGNERAMAFVVLSSSFLVIFPPSRPVRIAENCPRLSLEQSFLYDTFTHPGPRYVVDPANRFLAERRNLSPHYVP
jgi:hypothetical protein